MEKNDKTTEELVGEMHQLKVQIQQFISFKMATSSLSPVPKATSTT